MAIIDFGKREIQTRVVYFGPAGAGCTTNLRQLHKAVKASKVSQLHRFGPVEVEERTFYFEHIGGMPCEVADFSLRARVYSLPANMGLKAHRDEVMRDVDGVVFVADARLGRDHDNMDGLLALETLLTEQGLELANIPVVIQVNRTDDEDARPISEVTFDLNPYGFEVVRAAARSGAGVLDTYLNVLRRTTEEVRRGLTGSPTPLRLIARTTHDKEEADDVVRRHIEAIQASHQATTAHDLAPEADETPPRAPASPLDALPPDQGPISWQGPPVEVPIHHRELAGRHAVEVLHTQVDAGRILLDVLVEETGTAEAHRIGLVLVNRSTSTPVAAVTSPHPAVVTPQEEDRVSNYLPESYDLVSNDLAEPALPPVLFGVIGVIGGILIGLLAGYLLLVLA